MGFAPNNPSSIATVGFTYLLKSFSNGSRKNSKTSLFGKDRKVGFLNISAIIRAIYAKFAIIVGKVISKLGQLLLMCSMLVCRTFMKI